MAKEVNLSIPDELAERIDEKIKGTDFNSISDYILYILKQVISTKEKAIKNEQIYKEEEEEEIKRNLKELGYI
ncbi:MAG: ribbon-helix-helix domain-containing protein [Nanoarchaeota archaeon]|nr:ribbon-helix-helix domain-containing protein [Nanoarchaeota archaeon]MBU1051172.1 ribbon-helix-helix domain-containing protein [Nanoarchaeota archaeon]MBU1987988.1 ribbon-helix-helix domain-containing protein [Nanoarchaeota archaeon]